MSLFLTSDETFIDKSTNHGRGNNTRTSFSNYILPDFFQDAPFNLALKEVYFDPNFPSLANLDSPHVITLVNPSLHKLTDFPKNIQDINAFRSLFNSADDGKIYAPMRVFIDQLPSLDECHISLEIHPRLGFAFCIASARDVTIKSKTDVVSFLNQSLFPLHQKKPLNIETSGQVSISTNLSMFMSKNLLNLLGFTKLKNDNISCPVLKFSKLLQTKGNKSEDMTLTHQDSLARIAEESNLYTKYRNLNTYRPKGEIEIIYRIDEETFTSKVSLGLDLFTLNSSIAFDYDEQLDLFNNLLRDDWLTKMIIKATQTVPYSRTDFAHLRFHFEKVIEYVIKDNSGHWGGLITLRREGKVTTMSKSKYHGSKSTKIYNSFEEEITNSPLILKAALENVFIKPIKIEKIIFNETLSTLLNIDDGNVLNFDTSEKIILSQEIDYFKSARLELAKTFSVAPYSLHVMTLNDEAVASNVPAHTFKTEKENFFLLSNKKIYISDRGINLHINYPKLIFVTGNFVDHSFFGSRQEKILNFFPVDQKKNEIIYHHFENPIRLNINTDSNFHIKLLDENLEPLNAGIGVPTLLSLKKSREEKMFPVTIISSDHENIKLYPSNKSNSFINKLSIPLLFSDRTEWTVSLRCIAFPKICNIYPEYCNITLVKVNFGKQVEPPIKISVKSAYINNIDTLLSYINQTIKEEISKYPSESAVPCFKRVGKHVALETEGYDCILTRDMIKLLGFSHSYLDTSIMYDHENTIEGLTEPNLFIFQPQEIIVLSNIVEKSFYAQSRPNILRIIPIPFQEDVNAYNYIQFQNPDKIPVTFDRISDIKIDIITRKGELVSFTDQNDVKIQLEFEKKKV